MTVNNEKFLVLTKERLKWELENLTVTKIAKKYKINKGVVSKIKNNKIQSYKVGSKGRLSDRFNSNFNNHNCYKILDMAVAKLQALVGGYYQCDNLRDYLLDWYYSRPESFFQNKGKNFDYFLYVCFKTEGKRCINKFYKGGVKLVMFPDAWY